MNSRVANEQLPHGWDQQYDESTGRCFFVDHNTKTTTWDDPRRPQQQGHGVGGMHGSSQVYNGQYGLNAHGYAQPYAVTYAGQQQPGFRGPYPQQQMVDPNSMPWGTYIPQGYGSGYPQQALGSQYGAHMAGAQYPPQGPSGQYPQQNPNGQHHPQGPSGQYPPQGPSGQHHPQGPSGQHPQPGSNSQYPLHGSNAQYPPQGPNDQYPPQGPSGQYPPQSATGQYPASGTWGKQPGSGNAPYPVYGNGEVNPQNNSRPGGNSPYGAQPTFSGQFQPTPTGKTPAGPGGSGDATRPQDEPQAAPRPTTMKQEDNHKDVAKQPVAALSPQEAAMESIQQISSKANELKSTVEQFIGNKRDKQYVYLEEMLTQLLIKLDKIDSYGQENIRTMRKNAVRTVQMTIDQLELKATAA